MNSSCRGIKIRRTINYILAFSIVLIIHSGVGVAGQALGVSAVHDFGGIIPLTPGSSSTVSMKSRGSVDVTMVLCMGEGTLTVGLTKDDTQKDLVSMFIIGFPADPFFIPNFAVTPASISASTVIDDTLGGYGMVFIFSGVYSGARPPHEYTLSLGLSAQ